MERHVVQRHKIGSVLQNEEVFTCHSWFIGHIYSVNCLFVNSFPYSSPVDFTRCKISGPSNPGICVGNIIIHITCLRHQDVKFLLCYLVTKLGRFCNLSFKPRKNQLQVAEVVIPSKAVSNILVISFAQHCCFYRVRLSETNEENQLWYHETIQYEEDGIIQAEKRFIVLQHGITHKQSGSGTDN